MTNNARKEATTAPQAPIPTRFCENYNPAPFMREFAYDNGNRELYLEVKYRVDWFLHWCKENGVEGMIDEGEVTFLPDANLVLATCVVYIDDKVAARGTAGRALPPSDFQAANIAVQTACTCAKGRALANLGFGTVNGNSSENGEPFPPDAGLPLASAETTQNPLEVGEPGLSFTPAPAPAKRGRPRKADKIQPLVESPKIQLQPAELTDKPKEPIAQAPGSPVVPAPKPVNRDKIPTTLEEAKAYICPIGLNKGQPMGQVWVTDPNKIRFYGSEKFTSRDRYPALIAAVKLILENQ